MVSDDSSMKLRSSGNLRRATRVCVFSIDGTPPTFKNPMKLSTRRGTGFQRIDKIDHLTRGSFDGILEQLNLVVHMQRGGEVVVEALREKVAEGLVVEDPFGNARNFRGASIMRAENGFHRDVVAREGKVAQIEARGGGCLHVDE